MEATSPPSPQPHPAMPPKASGLAIASLVLGIISVLGSCITGIPAIICGHLALSKIKKSAGQIGGFGLALTGLILGYIFTAFAIIYAGLAVPTAMKALHKAEQVTLINNGKALKSSLDLYAASNAGSYPASMTDLIPSAIGSRSELDELLAIKGGGEFSYVSGLTQSSPGNLIVFYSPPLKPDTRIVIRVDSTAQTLDNAAAEAELSAQGISP